MSDATSREEAAVDRRLAGAVCGVLLVTTFGQGGASPTVMLAVHAALLLVVARTLAGPARYGPRDTAEPVLAASVLFLLLVVAGGIAAPYSYAALASVLEVVTFLAVAWLAARAGPGLRGLAATPLLVGAALQGGWTVYQRLAEDAARPAGTFLNPNHLGAWLAAVVLLAAGSSLGDVGTRVVAVRAVLAIPAVIGLFLSGSRGALLGLAAGGLGLAWGAARRLPRARRTAAGAAFAIVLLAAAIGVATRGAAFDPFRYQRIAIWRAALKPALEHPWTGLGPRQWGAAANNLTFPLEDGPLRYERIVDSSHSDLIRLPSELGWPAAIVAFVALGLLARELGRGSRSGGLDGPRLGAVAALAALGVQALVDNLSSRPAVYLLAAALAGSALSARAAPRRRAAAAWRVGAVVLLACAFAAADGAPYLAWRIHRDLAPYHGRLSPQRREELAAARRLNPLHPDLWLRHAQDLAGDGSDWDDAVYAQAREAAERAVRLQPVDARYRLGLARIERLAFATLFGDEAARARTLERYRAAQALARHDAALAIEEGAFLLRAADPAGARRAAERALAIEPNSVPARLLLAQAIAANGTADAASRAEHILEEARGIAAQWTDRSRESDYARFHLGLDPEGERAVAAAVRAAGGEADRGAGP
jgi:O-antigen ligase